MLKRKYIVLLILAGISISMISGNNSILIRANQSKERNITEQEKEFIKLAYGGALTNNLGDGVTDENLQTELDGLVGNYKTEVSKNDDDSLNILFTDTGHNYTFDGNTITEVIVQELHITNYNELLSFANRVNNGESFKNYIIYLDNNIILEDDEWVVIGCYGGRDNPSMGFKGIFEGNNHSIENVKITSNGYVGFFYSNYGTIRNINLELIVNSVGRIVCGGICSINYSNISNCNVTITANIDTSNVNLNPALGGISGVNEGTINSCRSTGTISVEGIYICSGGLAGSNSGTISNCSNTLLLHQMEALNQQQVQKMEEYLV